MKRLILIPALGLALAGCGATPATPSVAPTAPTMAGAADLGSVKTYLIGKSTQLEQDAAALKTAAAGYYDLANAARFDYATLWNTRQDDVTNSVFAMRAAWIKASPTYEQMEGIVGGVSSLAQYDVILDAGSSGAEGGDNVSPIDLTLPNGQVIAKPGNLFGVTESSLWGTFPAFTAQGVNPDFNGNGAQDFGESLPDANVIKAATAALDDYSGNLLAAANNWTPTPADNFNALVVMVPTMNELFESWKNSRFVSGKASTQRDFVVISRLSDIGDILSSTQVIYNGISPMVKGVDPDQDKLIASGLADLKSFVGDIYAQENAGKQFKPEEADLLGQEAQDRATAIAGHISQVAARLNITIES